MISLGRRRPPFKSLPSKNKKVTSRLRGSFVDRSPTGLRGLVRPDFSPARCPFANP
jgi:hypothetical protein